MPHENPRPRARDFTFLTGFGTRNVDRSGLAEATADWRDEQGFIRTGYYPQEMRQAVEAMDAAEKEWQVIVGEMQGRIGEIGTDPAAQRLNDYYRSVMSGENVPFGAETVSTLSSQATAPLFSSARSNIERLRDSFARRGLGRSGGIGSLESRYLSDAAGQASQAAAGVRSQAAISNFGARETASQGLQGLYGTQQQMRNSLQTELSRMRSQRNFSPTQFLNPQLRGTQTTGGYSAPPPQDRQSAGRSVPTYRRN